ncbi:MAG TPA: methionine--tRNA ligase [Thermoanaerobaculia bacterium]|nr:methionine--tRNA ligase [Thermoanaerobaculia bacterium]
MRTFYVTTPIYYVNDLPHIGHIYTTIVADTLARFHRLAGEPVHFLTGTDEHGQKIERAAAEQGIAPIALADRVVARFHEVWQQFGISNDDFIRTTEPRHRLGVEALIQRLYASGDLYVDKHTGWYCTPCETFYTEKELLPGNLCPIHELPVERQEEENVFFRLSRYQDRLLEWYDSQTEPVRPRVRANEVRSFVASGLRDLSVSRSNLAWGLPFPGHPGHTVYVWLDALSNYITALGFGRPGEDQRYQDFWASEGGVRLHLVGKDILRHHCVYWPAFLMAAGLPLPSTVFVHGFWLRDAKKIAKSTGSAVRPDEIVSRFGPDSLRYFLLREMVFGQDASFSDEGFVDRYNSDLANDLGNTISRLVTLSRRAFGGLTPPESCADNPLIPVAESVAAEYRQAMEEPAFSRALEALWKLLAETNQYIVERQPWTLLGKPEEARRLSRILWNGLEAVRIVATGLLPVMPAIAPRLLAAIGQPEPPSSLAALAWGGLANSVPLPEPSPLFPRIDKAAYLADAQPTAPAKSAPEKKMVSIDEFFKTELKVATVQAAEAVPKSSKLVKLTVDLGDEVRTVVAGIVQQYPPESLVGRQVILVANLEPAKLMGIESQGMVLAASIDGLPVLLQPERAVPNGTRVK